MKALKRFDLLKTDKTIGCCFALGCDIYKHKDYGFYISEYDIHKDERLPTGMYIVFNNKNSIQVSEELLLRTHKPFYYINEILNVK